MLFSITALALDGSPALLVWSTAEVAEDGTVVTHTYHLPDATVADIQGFIGQVAALLPPVEDADGGK